MTAPHLSRPATTVICAATLVVALTATLSACGESDSGSTASAPTANAGDALETVELNDAEMTAWLTAAGASTTMDMSDGHDMSAMDGMMDADDMEALEASAAAEFDRTWLEMMIVHHKGALSQAEEVKANGANADVLALADEIITAQTAEITKMQGLLDG